jgi:hypothetical protein
MLKRFAGAHDEKSNESKPRVIAQRGASGYVPEHTLVSYCIAIQLNEIGGTNDVGERPEFAARYGVRARDEFSS